MKNKIWGVGAEDPNYFLKIENIFVNQNFWELFDNIWTVWFKIIENLFYKFLKCYMICVLLQIYVVFLYFQNSILKLFKRCVKNYIIIFVFAYVLNSVKEPSEFVRKLIMLDSSCSFILKPKMFRTTNRGEANRRRNRWISQNISIAM